VKTEMLVLNVTLTLTFDLQLFVNVLLRRTDERTDRHVNRNSPPRFF